MSSAHAFSQGYSLHAGRLIQANDRNGLEKLCRYGARAPIAKERLSLDAKGMVIVKLKKRYFDGRTQIKFSQIEFIHPVQFIPKSLY